MLIPPRTERKYESYPEYKDLCVEWLDQIPSHWNIKRLKRISSVKFSGVDKHSKEGEKPVFLCNYTDVYNKDTILLNNGFMEATATDNEIALFSLKRDDVIITKDSEDWKDIAVPSYIFTDLPGVICGYHLALIHPELITGRFLFWSFYARNINHQFVVASTGITRFGLGKYWLDNSLFFIPPISEQQAIADFLDQETARIDELIARKQSLIDLLKEQRTTLITHTVTKGLNQGVPMKDSEVEWLGQIPVHWEVKKLKHVLLRNDGGVWGDDYDENGTIVLRSTEQTIGGEWCINEPAIRRINAEEYKKSKLICGDLLITKSSGSELHIGKTTLVTKTIEDMNCCFSNFMQRIRLLSNYSAKYIYYVFNCILGREQLVYYSNTTTGLANLSSTIIGNIHIAMPNYSEQQAITDYLDQETSRIDNLVSRINQAIEKLQEYRSATITAAVTGKIDVRQQVS